MGKCLSLAASMRADGEIFKYVIGYSDFYGMHEVLLCSGFISRT